MTALQFKTLKAVSAKKYRDSEKGRSYRLLENARRRAKKNGMVCDITISDIKIPELCPLLGIAIILGGDGVFNMNSPSLDRIDNSKGYVRGNIRVISLKANKLKSNLSLDELRFFAFSLPSYIETTYQF